MNDISSLLDNKASLALLDHLTVEIHIWKIIWTVDNEIYTWELKYANPPALKTWGHLSLEEIKNKSTDEIFGYGATEHFMPIVQKIVKEGKAYSYQDYFQNLEKHFRFTSVPFGDYFITTGDDITEFVEKHQNIVEEKKELEKLVKQRAAKLEAKEEEIKQLRGVIPICNYCHNIRDDEGAWNQLESYITQHSDAQFSHGICPNCKERAFEDAED